MGEGYVKVSAIISFMKYKNIFKGAYIKYVGRAL